MGLLAGFIFAVISGYILGYGVAVENQNGILLGLGLLLAAAVWSAAAWEIEG